MKFTVFSSDGRRAAIDIANSPPLKVTAASRREVIVAINANNRQNLRKRGARSAAVAAFMAPEGTGRARAGSIARLWGGGGVVFGPKPATIQKINAKVKQLAFSRALFDGQRRRNRRHRGL